jgi:hypothetical protein
VYDEYAGEGHTSFLPKEWPRSLEWMDRLRRNPCPARVVLTTYGERTGRAYWVTAGPRFDPLAPGRVEAEAGAGNRIDISTRNVGRLILHPGGAIVNPEEEIVLTIDGVCAFEGLLPEDGTLRLRRDGAEGPWRVGAAEAAPEGTLAKRAGLEGPVDDIFMREHLVIVSPDTQDQGLRRETTRILRELNDALGLSLSAVAASEIDEALLAKSNPIVIGTLKDNRVLAGWAAKLPVRISAKGVSVAPRGGEHTGDDVGCIFIAPSPANPQNYVVAIVGVTEAALHNASRLVEPMVDCALPDYAVFNSDTLNPAGRGGPWRFMDWGFFGLDWRPMAHAITEDR